MVKLRLKRIGKKHYPVYRIVAADARAPRDGRFIEELGLYNPHNKEVKLNEEKILKWLSNGAIATDTVKTLMTQQGILKTFHESKANAKKAKATK